MIMMVVPSVFASSFNDNDALSGFKQGKLLFDINLKSDKALVLYLKVIKKDPRRHSGKRHDTRHNSGIQRQIRGFP